MTNQNIQYSNAPIDYAAYELQARQLRAEAVRTFYLAARDYFVKLAHRGQRSPEGLASKA